MPDDNGAADGRTWDDFAIVTNPQSTWLLSETGWSAMVAWLAGPEWVVRRTAGAPPPVVVVRPTGATSTRSARPRTTREQAEIDDDIDDFLTASGCPERPRGYEWHLRTIPGVSEQRFWSYLDQHLNESDASSSSSPRDFVEHLRPVLSRLLAR